jgi:hypothetical protein
MNTILTNMHIKTRIYCSCKFIACTVGTKILIHYHYQTPILSSR